MEPIILVHGGACDIPESKVAGKMSGLKLAAQAGYKILAGGGSSLDAVEAAVRVMEDDVNFNAGYGSVLNLDGEVAMDAGIMNGKDLNAGAVALVQDVKNPITLARKVMENSPHTLLGAHGASRFARDQSIPAVDPESLVSNDAKEALEEFKRTGSVQSEFGHKDKIDRCGGTVGAVALDKRGHLAAATSTGGLTGKMVGRIGDSPIFGSGTYADDLYGAVSCTGHGESILKYCVAHRIITELELGKTAAEATKNAIEGMHKRLNNTAGAITLSKSGDVGIHFSSKKMAWAWQKKNEIHYGLNHDEEYVYKV